MSSKKYIAGSLQIVDGTQGVGKVLTSNTAGLSTWAHISAIGITYADLYFGLTSSTLVKDATYHITDKKIWLKALETNLLSTSGQRKMTIIKDIAYHGTGTLGVWDSTLTPSINDKVIWGGKLWINTTGSVGSNDDETTMNATDWTLITSDTLYYDKIFDIEYDFSNDSINLQSDDWGNIVRVYNVLYSYINITDWGNALIKNNSTYGVYNNHGDIEIYENENCFRIFANKAGSIYRNLNIAGIFSNSGGVVENIGNRMFQITLNTGWIARNIMRGDIISNSTSVQYNSNNGNISGNTAYVTNNSNNGVISNNACNITYNTNNGVISNNTIAVLAIYRNHNNGSINDNSNIGEIYKNNNTGNIFNNSNVGEISYNSNNGNIEDNTQTSGTCNITNNNNNGNITGARTTDVTDAIVNK